jgi:hypothetical protein
MNLDLVAAEAKAVFRAYGRPCAIVVVVVTAASTLFGRKVWVGAAVVAVILYSLRDRIAPLIEGTAPWTLIATVATLPFLGGGVVACGTSLVVAAALFQTQWDEAARLIEVEAQIKELEELQTALGEFLAISQVTAARFREIVSDEQRPAVDQVNEIIACLGDTTAQGLEQRKKLAAIIHRFGEQSAAQAAIIARLRQVLAKYGELGG